MNEQETNVESQSLIIKKEILNRKDDTTLEDPCPGVESVENRGRRVGRIIQCNPSGGM